MRSVLIRVAASALVSMLLVSAVLAQQPAGGDLSAVDRRMFDAVFNNKLAGVQASIATGANVNAENE